MAVAVQSCSIDHLVPRHTQDKLFVQKSAPNNENKLLVRKPKLLRWKRPSHAESFVINCDGSYRSSAGTVGYGFVIRDFFGRLILARAVHLQKADYINNEVNYENVVVLTEMLAILDGMQHAKMLGITQVEIHSDSQIAISVINGWVKCPLHLLIMHSIIQLEMPFFQTLDFSFVYRECNRAADFLSKFLKDDGRLYFDLSGLPNQLQRIMYEDALGFINIRF